MGQSDDPTAALLADLRAQIAAAQADREPISARLGRLDDRLAEIAAARAERDRLAAEHGLLVAAAIEAGEPPPIETHAQRRAEAMLVEAGRHQEATRRAGRDPRLGDTALGRPAVRLLRRLVGSAASGRCRPVPSRRGSPPRVRGRSGQDRQSRSLVPRARARSEQRRR
jgi:hypothetical protein